MPKGPLIYRHRRITRLTHWVWAICLFFLLLTGLQIFNAHPTLYLGAESGFEYANSIFEIGARAEGDSLKGYTRVFGIEFDTTGTLGTSNGEVRAFPAALTIPSKISLATGRSIHFAFAWALTITLLFWIIASLLNGHLRELIPTPADAKALPRDIADHARLRLHHTGRYGPLQKLAYVGVLLVALPLMILTGLAMSPAMNAAAPWLLDLFAGRQTARTLHFATMLALLAFFVIHMAMTLLAGPINELRAILTGWYRTDAKDRS